MGNPSNVDLESLSQGSIEFDPPTWHTSVGRCEGYLASDTQALNAQLDSRGRPATRGEIKQLVEASPADAEAGHLLQHSCWTYWGHSGAPLFTRDGHVVGMHCAWNERTGLRYGQKLEHLHAVLSKAATATRVKRHRGR